MLSVINECFKQNVQVYTERKNERKGDSRIDESNIISEQLWSPWRAGLRESESLSTILVLKISPYDAPPRLLHFWTRQKFSKFRVHRSRTIWQTHNARYLHKSDRKSILDCVLLQLQLSLNISIAHIELLKKREIWKFSKTHHYHYFSTASTWTVVRRDGAAWLYTGSITACFLTHLL